MKKLTTLAALCLVFLFLSRAVLAGPDHPNIVIILSDDYGYGIIASDPPHAPPSPFIDVDPAKVGRDLGELLGGETPRHIADRLLFVGQFFTEQLTRAVVKLDCRFGDTDAELEASREHGRRSDDDGQAPQARPGNWGNTVRAVAV